MLPLVSVIVPVHNGERFLAEAMASVLGQSYAPLEIIVVDDGSTDATPVLMAKLDSAIRGVRQPQAGPAAARNHGLALAQGDFIAFLDADDLWPADKLVTQMRRLLATPSLDVVLGRIQPIDALTTSERLAAPTESVMDVHLGSAVFRRRVFDRIGVFNAGLRYSEDHDWFLRAREQAVSMLILQQVTLLYRRHEDNMTRQPQPHGYQLPRVLKASLDRRRSQAAGHAPTLPKLSEFAETTEDTRG